MGLVQAPYAPKLPFTRPTTDDDGNVVYTSLGDTPVVLDMPSNTVFIPRGLDREAGDRFTYNDFHFMLVGVARGDHVHPFTGDDLGWVAFQFQEGKSPWT